MRKDYIEHYQREFESDAQGWKAFGAALVDDLAPYPCTRPLVVKHALCGQRQKAYLEWLKAGEYSREEELFLGFILATDAVYHHQPSAEIPELPKRIWNESEYKKWLREYDDDEFWIEICERLQTCGTTPWSQERNQFIELLGKGKAREAEAFYYARDWDHSYCAESDLALIHMCSYVLGDWKESEQMWFYADKFGRTRGPVRVHQIRRVLRSGRIPPTTCVYTDGLPCWQPAEQVAVLSPVFRGAHRLSSSESQRSSS